MAKFRTNQAPTKSHAETLPETQAKTLAETPAKLREESLSELYSSHCKPGLGAMLTAFGLDIPYEKASGDYLFYHDRSGRMRKILDLVGSFGATLMGHNYPRFKVFLRKELQSNPPNLVQASVRGAAARLGTKLFEIARDRLGELYISNFYNSGAEATEAAIKHLILIKRAALDHLQTEIMISASGLLHHPTQTLCAAEFRSLSEFLGEKFSDEDGILAALDRYNSRVFDIAFPVLAIENAFHGKTLGALGLTHNARYRDPFSHFLFPVSFIPPDPKALKIAVSRNKLEPLKLVRGPIGRLSFEPSPVSAYMGLFLEPVLGEGGAVPLPDGFIKAAMESCHESGIPTVADEIQTGMGRTGTFFAWEQSGAPPPDFVLLSKVLGGGLLKISAVLSRKEISEDEFGIIHTSTFAEDELSCRLALEVIETITGNDGAVLSDVRSAGDAWLERLRSLKAEFPDVIAEIHGRGLLLGIEFHDLRESGSNLLRFLAAQGDLGYLFSTYLLHAHGIRVTPTLNAKRTIRIEPSVLLSAKEIERVVKAFGALCRILRLRDTFHLVKFIVPELREPDARRRFEIQDHRRDPGSIMQTKAQPKAEDRSQESEDRSRNTEGRKAQAQPQPQPHIQPQPQAQPQPQPQPHIQPQPQPQAQAEGRNQALALSQPQAPDPARLQATDKVAFLGHFIDPSFLAQHEPSLKRLSESQLAEVIERTWEYVDPCLFASRDITSPLGPTVNFNFIGLSVTSEILLRHFLAHDLKTIRQQLVQAVEAGRNAGCRLVGFGQFTSILTRNCQELYVPGIHFTSGNTLTAGMALQALDQEVRRRGWSWPDVKLGIVGAGGNIGSTFARLLADKAGKLLIIGGTASDSRRRIEGTMHTILAEQAAKVLAGQVDSPLAEFLCSSLGQRKLDDLCVKSRAADEMAFGAAVAEALAEGSRHTIPIGIGDISGLPACQAILAATNATEPFIRPEDLASEAVICDVSLPAALTREAIAKPGIEVFKGGIVGLPNHEVLNIGALPLAPGLVYACMAETILLGLERRWEDFSVGRLEKHKILEMLALADKHGFRLARLKQEASF